MRSRVEFLFSNPDLFDEHWRRLQIAADVTRIDHRYAIRSRKPQLALPALAACRLICPFALHSFHSIGNAVCDARQRANSSKIEISKRLCGYTQDAPVARHPE